MTHAMVLSPRLVLSFLLLVTAHGLAAQTTCPQDQVLNRLAVEIRVEKQRRPKIPDGFSLIDDGSPRRLLQPPGVTRQGNFWICNPCEGLRGREHRLKPQLQIPGYTIEPVWGSNRPLVDGGKCYAVFTFTAAKTSWELEVSPKPDSPFGYQTNNGDFKLCSPQSGAGWKMVSPLQRGDVVKLKIYEVEGSKRQYLFSLPVLMDDIPSKNTDGIADKILEERREYRFGNTGPEEELKPDDPYLDIVKKDQLSNSSDRSSELARSAVKKRLKLFGLDLVDKTEDR